MKEQSKYIIATGFTTAFLGDERTLREFIVGDHLRDKLSEKGKDAVLYLINDSYDPLNYRQLRVGVNKDERLIKKFEGYCGRPIAEVPDPFDCHESYSGHFANALVERLSSIGVHPVLFDSYQAYQNGYYSDFISTTFSNYNNIQESLSEKFNNFTIRNLFRCQCPECLCIDGTTILNVSSQKVLFACERCGKESKQDVTEIRGKLSWKLDCAARWNLYGIDMETFSKAHLEELGSVEISRYMSRHFYGGKIPAVVRYGDVKISSELSYKLLEILPPPVFKGLFTSNLMRDVSLTRDYVENYSRKFIIHSGMSYVDYVKRELPKDAILNETGHQQDKDKSLVKYGNKFSMFYYGKEYGIRLPDLNAVISAPQTTAQIANEIILYSLTIRNTVLPKDASIGGLIKSYLFERKISGEVYRYLRCMLGQNDGPNITTLLSIMPVDFLNMIHGIICCYTGELTIEDKMSNVPEELITILSKLEVVHEKHEVLSDSFISYSPARMPEEGRNAWSRRTDGQLP